MAKFFNTDFDDDEDLEESEYSDKIKITHSKSADDYLDRNNPITKIVLSVLGGFCLIGVIYYVIAFFQSR